MEAVMQSSGVIQLVKEDIQEDTSKDTVKKAIHPKADHSSNALRLRKTRHRYSKDDYSIVSFDVTQVVDIVGDIRRTSDELKVYLLENLLSETIDKKHELWKKNLSQDGLRKGLDYYDESYEKRRKEIIDVFVKFKVIDEHSLEFDGRVIKAGDLSFRNPIWITRHLVKEMILKIISKYPPEVKYEVFSYKLYKRYSSLLKEYEKRAKM